MLQTRPSVLPSSVYAPSHNKRRERDIWVEENTWFDTKPNNLWEPTYEYRSAENVESNTILYLKRAIN